MERKSKLPRLTSGQFHTIWTAAVGRPDYNKAFFRDLYADLQKDGTIIPSAQALEMETHFYESTGYFEFLSRVEVIDHSPACKGRVYVNMNAKDVQLSFQDDKRTLKIFIH